MTKKPETPTAVANAVEVPSVLSEGHPTGASGRDTLLNTDWSVNAVVPNAYVSEIVDLSTKPNPWYLLLNRPTRPPLTRWQKFRLWRSDIRWAIHNWLFPECRDDDDRY